MNIKIREQQAVKAYKVIFELKSQTMPIKSAYGLYMLKNVLQPTFIFHSEQEAKIVSECNGAIHDNGTVTFINEQDRINFIAKQQELKDQDVQLDFNPVSLPETIMISMDDLEAIHQFVKFE